jgi:hypothetical protein
MFSPSTSVSLTHSVYLYHSLHSFMSMLRNVLAGYYFLLKFKRKEIGTEITNPILLLHTFLALHI